LVKFSGSKHCAVERAEWLFHLEGPIIVITTAPIIERELNAHEKQIGDDILGYRGHVYRVLSYAMHYLKENDITPHDYELLQLALVYHDIGALLSSHLVVALTWQAPACTLTVSCQQDCGPITRSLILSLRLKAPCTNCLLVPRNAIASSSTISLSSTTKLRVLHRAIPFTQPSSKPFARRTGLMLQLVP
jgi:hypothetical protein